MEKLTAILRKLGLNKYEANAYLGLVSSGISTAGKLAEKSDIPRAKIYEVLRNLEKNGFVISNNARPSKFKAVPIGDVVKRLHHKIKTECDKRIVDVNEIHEEFRSQLGDLELSEESEPEDLVWILRGRDNIYGTIDDLVDGSKRKIIGATTERGIVRKLFRHKEKLIQAAQRGVDVRMLAPITSSNKDIVKVALGELVIHHGNSVSARFFLSDDERGVIFLMSDEDGGSKINEIGLYLNSPYFVSGLGHYFEHKWEKTIPLDERLAQLGG